MSTNSRSRKQRFLSLTLAILMVLPLLATNANAKEDELWGLAAAELKRQFRGSIVTLNVNLPYTRGGLHFFPERERNRLVYRGRGLGASKNDDVMITRVKVNTDSVELIVGRGVAEGALGAIRDLDWPAPGGLHGGRIIINFEGVFLSPEQLAPEYLVKVLEPVLTFHGFGSQQADAAGAQPAPEAMPAEEPKQ
jgi:hypothetical protein